MTPLLPGRDAATDRVPQSAARPYSSIEDELAVVADELAAARDLQATFDPDSPAWSVEAELRRLELRWDALAAHEPPPPSPGGGASRATDQRAAVRGRVTRTHVHTQAARSVAD